MHRRTIPTTAVRVTELGFGASVIGNLYRATSAEDAAAAVDAAREAGIRSYDTAPTTASASPNADSAPPCAAAPASSTSGMKYDYQAAPPALVDRAIAYVCQAHGTTLPAAAIAFPLTHPSVINVTLGMRDPGQVRRSARLHQQPIPQELWHDLRDQGLLRAETPCAPDERSQPCP